MHPGSLFTLYNYMLTRRKKQRSSNNGRLPLHTHPADKTAKK